MNKQTYSSNTKWEDFVGYARAVRVGNTVHIAGTTATNSTGELVGVGSAYEQTVQILRNIEQGLQGVGGELTHVVRTRIFVTNVADWEEIGRAHGEVFRDIRPACTLVEVSQLINPDMLVEIEAEAIII